MTEDRTRQPERFDFETPPMPQSRPGSVTLGIELDNVNRAETPADLVAGPNEAGVRTEWDATSLDSAIRWLQAHADYLNKLSHEMDEIQDLMGGAAAASGAPGTKSPLGGFDKAGTLAKMHGSLFSSTQTGMRTLATNLYDAAEALRQVKENYETAEQANRMTALDMQKIFTDAAGGGGSQ